jgi:hypothetical protein
VCTLVGEVLVEPEWLAEDIADWYLLHAFGH